jgi:hypothetical protein
VKAFFKISILVCATTSDPKKQRAADCLGRGGLASVQQNGRTISAVAIVNPFLESPL